MSALWLAVILSVVSTVAYAFGAVAQRRIAAPDPRTPDLARAPAAHAAPPAIGYPAAATVAPAAADRAATVGPLPLRLLLDRTWWLAIALNCVGGFLHILALRFGPLTLVQPLGALTLVFALLLSARRPGHRVSRTEWRGAALTMWGLAGLLALTATAAPDRVLTSTAALGVGAAAVVAAVVLALATGRGAGPTPRALALAAASGIVSGASSALTRTVTLRLPVEGVAVLVGPVSLVVAAFAVTGFLLAQASYRGGLGAPLAVLTIANPLSAAVIGIALLGERFTAGPPGALAAAGAAVLTGVGVVLLSRPGPRAAAVEPSLVGARNAAG